MSVESRVAAVTRRSRRQRIKIGNLDATRLCPIAFPPISTDYQFFTHHGFASPGNHRRDHQQPPNLQPPLLFSRRETVAEMSQQRTFRVIRFPNEATVNNWYMDTRNEPDGIASYVQVAKFRRITKWTDPTLFIRVLESFTSLTRLWTLDTEIPDEILEHVSHGELGRRITALHLRAPRCSISTVISMSLSLPNLQKLSVDNYRITPGETPSTYPVLPRSGPLNWLFVSGYVEEVVEALANSQFTSHRLLFDFRIRNIQKLLISSSTIIRELMLVGTHSVVDCRSGDGDRIVCR